MIILDIINGMLQMNLIHLHILKSILDNILKLLLLEFPLISLRWLLATPHTHPSEGGPSVG